MSCYRRIIQSASLGSSSYLRSHAVHRAAFGNGSVAGRGGRVLSCRCERISYAVAKDRASWLTVARKFHSTRLIKTALRSRGSSVDGPVECSSSISTVETVDDLLRNASSNRLRRSTKRRQNAGTMQAVLWILSRCTGAELNQILTAPSPWRWPGSDGVPPPLGREDALFRDEEEKRSASAQKRMLAALLFHRLRRDPGGRVQLYDILGKSRLDDLSTPSKCVIIKAIHAKKFRTEEDERFMLSLIVSTRHYELTDLKNLLMSGGTIFNLQRLIFRDFSEPARRKALGHFRSEAENIARDGPPPVKVLSDIDDTIFAVLHDRRYPLNTVYPGVKAFLDELEVSIFDRRRQFKATAKEAEKLEHLQKHLEACARAIREQLSGGRGVGGAKHPPNFPTVSGWDDDASSGASSAAERAFAMPALGLPDDLFLPEASGQGEMEGGKQAMDPTDVAIIAEKALLSRELSIDFVQQEEQLAEYKNDIAFLTARPQGWRNVVTMLTRRRLHRKLGAPKHATMLSGTFRNLFNHKQMAEKKFNNFEEFCAMFPEYDYVLLGDAGQGDASLGAMAKRSAPFLGAPGRGGTTLSGSVRAVFIHDITPEKEVTGDGGLKKDYIGQGGLLFHRNYVDAAVQACQLGLIPAEAVVRIAESATRSLCATDFGDSAKRRSQHAQRLEELGVDVEAACHKLERLNEE